MFLIVHGGAGNIRPTQRALKKLSESISSGYNILNKDGAALDAVVESIRILEDSGIFNAGSGGNLQFDGIRRLDASLMDGRNLKTGSVIGLEGIKNPIKAARLIMQSPHAIMTNIGAKKIFMSANLKQLARPDKKSLKKLAAIKKKQTALSEIYEKHFSTVGAVSLDVNGNLAAGSSTGGIIAMLPGRVGDTPIIGAGVYAENSLGAVSCTGIGESIIRLALAKEIVVGLKDLPPSKSAHLSLKRLSKIKGEAGVIVINRKGQFTIQHTTKYMAAGYVVGKGMTIRDRFY